MLGYHVTKLGKLVAIEEMNVYHLINYLVKVLAKMAGLRNGMEVYEVGSEEYQVCQTEFDAELTDLSRFMISLAMRDNSQLDEKFQAKLVTIRELLQEIFLD